jgi:hypothetical protein
MAGGGSLSSVGLFVSGRWGWPWRAASGMTRRMDALTAFGLFAVSFTLVCYALEARAPFWTLLFAIGCLLGSVYGFLQGAWPFGLVELAWFVVALRRWGQLRRGVRNPLLDTTLPPP